MESPMRTFCLTLLLLAAAPAAAAPADSGPAAGPAFTYADLADLALAAPVAAHVRVAAAIAVKDEQAPGLRPGFGRLYVEADVVALIRSAGPLPARLRYVVDLPRDAKGRTARLRKGTELLILGAPVGGRDGEVRLAAPDAQIPYTQAAAARLRAIVREASAAAPPPRITGVGKAFHVPGSLPGESETQIFLQTADRRPVSLTVLRRPGQTPQWAAALGEIVDDAAAPPAPETLLWYRLACSLPPRLPAQSLAEAEPGSGAAIEADYRLVLERLGPCTRNRRP
ncbi:MAG: hypothetical protein JOZ90_01785 [Alphaproteobacteria bacterium]|nr:hypothetical protein [Alphaproteobacteria bacterium]MBV9370735.1 hypothetical protein [Alphaproteobacteria bacterium]MBV9899808.1 hypothetical protein [Alphaproteobacteria bacterium]